jgi:hypothetical protein
MGVRNLLLPRDEACQDRSSWELRWASRYAVLPVGVGPCAHQSQFNREGERRSVRYGMVWAGKASVLQVRSLPLPLGCPVMVAMLEDRPAKSLETDSAFSSGCTACGTAERR